MSGTELQRLETHDNDQFNQVVSSVQFTDAVFKVRAKNEMYNDEAKVRFGVMSYEKMDYAKEGMELVQAIEAYRT